jgi:hypothetical protein
MILSQGHAWGADWPIVERIADAHAMPLLPLNKNPHLFQSVENFSVQYLIAQFCSDFPAS